MHIIQVFWLVHSSDRSDSSVGRVHSWWFILWMITDKFICFRHSGCYSFSPWSDAIWESFENSQQQWQQLQQLVQQQLKICCNQNQIRTPYDRDFKGYRECLIDCLKMTHRLLLYLLTSFYFDVFEFKKKSSNSSLAVHWFILEVVQGRLD